MSHSRVLLDTLRDILPLDLNSLVERYDCALCFLQGGVCLSCFGLQQKPFLGAIVGSCMSAREHMARNIILETLDDWDALYTVGVNFFITKPSHKFAQKVVEASPSSFLEQIQLCEPQARILVVASEIGGGGGIIELVKSLQTAKSSISCLYLVEYLAPLDAAYTLLLVFPCYNWYQGCCGGSISSCSLCERYKNLNTKVASYQRPCDIFASACVVRMEGSGIIDSMWYEYDPMHVRASVVQ